MEAVELEGLTRDFGGQRAVDGLSFEVAEGEVFGLLGPNGAGKTTTIRMLSTVIAPHPGTARVHGFDIRTRIREVRLPETPGACGLFSGARDAGGAAVEAPSREDRLP